jgi:hypothetical protein
MDPPEDAEAANFAGEHAAPMFARDRLPHCRSSILAGAEFQGTDDPATVERAMFIGRR